MFARLKIKTLSNYPVLKGIFIVLVLLAIFVIPNIAKASVIDSFAENAIKGATALVLSIFTALFGFLITLEGKIIAFLLDPANFQYYNNAGVRTGWRLIRDFVNLGFVLAIIVIAIGFILRLQTYGSMRTLSRLIIAAILVNFSLVISAVFIDTAALFSVQFLTKINFQNVWIDSVSALAEAIYKLPDLLSGVGTAVGGFIAVILFLIILMAVLAAFMVMLFLRIGWLWFLLIISPAAWFFWIFPALESNWRKWWKDFLRWTFFAPMVLFFVYVSVTLLNAYDIGTNPSFMDQVTRYFLSIILLTMSMVVANDLSITFADTGLKWATVTKWPKTALGRAVGREGGRRFSTSGIGKALEERLYRSRIPGLGGVADRIRGMRTDVGEDATKLATRYQGMTSSTILSDLSDPTRRRLMSQAEILARAKVVNDRGDRLPQDLAGTVLQLAHNVNPKLAESFMPANPELVDSYERDIARRPEGKRRTITDYSARMTPEQATAISVDRLNAMSDQQRMQFALGVRQSVLASLFDSKNSAAADRIVAEISKTNEELKTAGISDAEIKRAKNMLKSPNISIYVEGEGQRGVREAEEELKRAGKWPFQG